MIYPVLVIEIPLHRFTDAGLKRLCRLPAQLLLNFAGVNCIAAVMAGPVGHKGKQVAIPLFVRRVLSCLTVFSKRSEFFKRGTNEVKFPILLDLFKVEFQERASELSLEHLFQQLSEFSDKYLI